MDRADEILNLDAAPWLRDPAVQRVCAAIRDGGHQIYFVGGCVRNALLGEPTADVDLATDAPPQAVMSLANAAGLKAVPTGIEHGTITVISDGAPFEVTTFRRDVETDGRRAVVAFSGTIEDDARRRDFTINALYATAEGRIIDPLGGMPDLLARRIRFIEDSEARIREDYLRILRFFRFYAWYGRSDEGFDPDALAAISANTSGLETLSAERISAEMKKLLCAKDPSQALAGMRQTGVLQIALPGSDDRMVGPVVHLEAMLGLEPDWILRLAALGGSDVTQVLRLSRADARHIKLLREIGFVGPPLPEVAYRHGERTALQVLILRAALAEDPPRSAEVEAIKVAAGKTFPVSAADLMPSYSGRALGQRLSSLEGAWIASGFSLDRAALMALPET